MQYCFSKIIILFVFTHIYVDALDDMFDFQANNQLIHTFASEYRQRKIYYNALNSFFNDSLFFNAHAIVYGNAKQADVIANNFEGKIVQLEDYFDFDQHIMKKFSIFLTADGLPHCNKNDICRLTYNFKTSLTEFAVNNAISSFVNIFEFYATVNNTNPITDPDFEIDYSFGFESMHTGFAKFNSDGKIEHAVLYVNLDINYSDINKFDIDLTIYQICASHLVFCQNTLYKQYDNFSQCVSHMLGMKNAEDVLKYHQFHIELAKLDPANFCQHLGHQDSSGLNR